MDMGHDGVAPQRLHGIHEDVSSGGLDDVLYELRTIAFQPLPLLRAAHPLIGDGLAAEVVLADLRFHIGQPSARGEGDEQKSALIGKAEAVRLRGAPFLYAPLDLPVYIPPELDDAGIGSAPSVYQRFQLIFRHTHFQCAHCF